MKTKKIVMLAAIAVVALWGWDRLKKGKDSESTDVEDPDTAGGGGGGGGMPQTQTKDVAKDPIVITRTGEPKTGGGVIGVAPTAGVPQDSPTPTPTTTSTPTLPRLTSASAFNAMEEGMMNACGCGG